MRVVVRGEWSPLTGVAVSFNMLPLVLSVAGCDKCDYTCTSPQPQFATTNCSKRAFRPLTIVGDYFGTPPASGPSNVAVYFADPFRSS